MKSTISINTTSQTSRKSPRRIRGQGMTEYIIVVALVGLAAVVAVGFFGDAIQGQFGAMGGALSGDAGAFADGVKASNEAGKAATTEAGTSNTLGDYGTNAGAGAGGGGG